jgi:hypothetical protein
MQNGMYCFYLPTAKLTDPHLDQGTKLKSPTPSAAAAAQPPRPEQKRPANWGSMSQNQKWLWRKLNG